jgi:hypothetical protein
MDPNANLAEQLKLAHRLLAHADGTHDVECECDTDLGWRLAQLVVDLDNWLRHDGGYPDEWANP